MNWLEAKENNTFRKIKNEGFFLFSYIFFILYFSSDKDRKYLLEFLSKLFKFEIQITSNKKLRMSLVSAIFDLIFSNKNVLSVWLDFLFDKIWVNRISIGR